MHIRELEYRKNGAFVFEIYLLSAFDGGILPDTRDSVMTILHLEQVFTVFHHPFLCAAQHLGIKFGRPLRFAPVFAFEFYGEGDAPRLFWAKMGNQLSAFPSARVEPVLHPAASHLRH